MSGKGPRRPVLEISTFHPKPTVQDNYSTQRAWMLTWLHIASAYAAANPSIHPKMSHSFQDVSYSWSNEAVLTLVFGIFMALLGVYGMRNWRTVRRIIRRCFTKVWTFSSNSTYRVSSCRKSKLASLVQVNILKAVKKTGSKIP